MNYYKIYDRLIDRAKDRLLNIDVYVEKHHIKPKCLGGSDKNSNIVTLTAREHFIAHQLLLKIYPKHKGVVFGAFMLSKQGKVKSSRNYKWVREKFISLNRGRRVKYISKTCIVCNKKFEVVPSKKHQICCSYKCACRGGYVRKKGVPVVIYDNKNSTWLTFESRKEATQVLKLNVGDCSSLLAGRLKYLKKGRYTTSAPYA